MSNPVLLLLLPALAGLAVGIGAMIYHWFKLLLCDTVPALIILWIVIGIGGFSVAVAIVTPHAVEQASQK
jgi:hypothetical protein